MTTTSPTNENAEALTETPTEESPSKKAEAVAKPEATAPPPKKEEHKNIGNFTVGK